MAAGTGSARTNGEIVVNRRVYRFDGAEVDTGQPGLRRGDVFVDLRQRAFHVLVYLIEQRDRVVTREELMEALWKDVVVTEGSLNQCVVDIRRALEDDPRQPRYVKTYPKSGYRFVCPVEVVPFGPAEPALARLEIASLEVEIEEEIPDPPAALPAPARRVPVSLSRLALLLAGVLIVGAAWRRAWRPDPRLPDSPGRTAVAVLLFENRSRSPELDWLREGLADMLITDLSRSSKLTLLSSQQLHVLLERVDHRPGQPIDLATALEIGRRSRAGSLILGAFQQIGPRVRLDAQLFDARTGQLSSAETLVAERPEQLLTQVSLLATKLAARLGAPLSSAGARPALAGMRTGSLDAYRYYALGIEKAHALHNADAVALFEKAIALDPGFAMAHARIGFTLGVSDTRLDEALPHLELAAASPDRLTEKDRLEVAAWTAIVKLDFGGAITTYRQLVARFPDEVEAYHRLGHLLQAEERHEEAIEVLRRGLVVDPDAKLLHNTLSGIYADLGRHDEAIAAAERYVALDPGEPNALDSLGLAFQWAGRYEEALEAYDRALALDPDFMVALAHQAGTLADLGRRREALAAFQRIAAAADTAWFRERGWDGVATLHLWRGDAASSAAASAHVSEGTSIASWWLALERRDLARARTLAAKLQTQIGRMGRGARHALRLAPYLAGRLALAEGDVETGLRELRNAIGHRPLRFGLDSQETCLADALLELGRHSEALAEYDRILRLNPRFPMALYRSALALQATGRREETRARLVAFLDVWKGADADAPPLVDAKRRLSRS